VPKIENQIKRCMHEIAKERTTWVELFNQGKIYEVEHA
jgi:hypothetical protein